ncbi:ABC transporter permease [Labrys miyagiensis]|uniref:ABC transporter permease n=1 Tax=Labrys miyagiensis TaxID=346912 RepID=A0ABQ6CIC4_9HYPH|nr:ABC transporter permease [Labrys miyagiensis]GLS19680.1 ABC transporter permease [Labrys miyagiensis]
MASSEKPAETGRLPALLLRLAASLQRSWPFLAFFVGLFLCWQWSVDLFSIPAYILPKPSEIVAKGWADIPRLSNYFLITGLESFLGYFLAIAVGLPMGLAIAFSPMLRRTIYPFFVSLEMVPKIAFAPLFISWLGFGLLPKVIIVVLVCFFPVALNAIHAFGSLSDELTRFCRSTGAGPWRTFWKVRLPAALPQCFVGFKYAAVNATVGATIAEFIGSDQGLGFYIQIVTGNMRPDLAFAGIFFLTVLGLLLFGMVTLAERLLIPWHISVRRH